MAGAHSQEQDLDVDIASLFAGLLANWLRIAVVALSVTAIAFMIATMATRHYKSETRILIESRESIFTRPASTAAGEPSSYDEQGVASQVEILTSSDLLKRVAGELDLAARPEFEAGAEVSFLRRLMIVAGLRGDPSSIPPEERVLKAMREKLSVYRVENSRVIVVEFSSEDPQLAADVPNAIADAYVALQRGAKLESNADATEWLEPEIADLRERVRQAEERVAEFRSSSDLLMGSNNSVLATQQLAELSSELSRVRANRASAEAIARTVSDALAAGAAIDSIPGVIGNGLIQRLRESEVQLKADIADLSATLLDNHPRLRSLRSQLADLQAQIRNEAAKILRSLETEAETARLRERELSADLAKLKVESARAGAEEVELRALEREAAAQRELLESYLSRYREAISRQDRNYLPVDARIFSRASVPGEPYFPKPLPIAGAAFAATLLLMAVATLLGELFSGRAMRPAARAVPAPAEELVMPADARPADTGSEEVRDERAGGRHDGEAPARAEAPAVAEPEAVREREEARVYGDAGEGTALAPGEQPRRVAAHLSVEDAAEQLISKGAARAIFVSPEGDEAAATSVMVAREIADAGLRVLLLDLTVSGAASAAMLDGAGKPGVTDLLCAQASFADIIHADAYSDCHVIPAGRADAERAMRAIDRLPIVMGSLNTAYDLVIVECGPTGAEGIRRLVSDLTEIMLSVIDGTDESVFEAASDLEAGGFGKALVVTPAAHGGPPPQPHRRSAA